MNRRKFLTQAGLGTVTLIIAGTAQKADAVIGCDKNNPRPASEFAGHAVRTQSVGCLLFEHYHSLDIPLEIIEKPPIKGIRLETSRNSAHSHYVDISYRELLAIKEGKTVTVSDRLHIEHEFTISMPQI